MSEIKECPNCKSSIKNGIISSNTLFSKMYTAIINEYNEPSSEGYCSKCGKELYEKHKAKIIEERKSLTKRMQILIANIPVISLHSPLNWDYEILGMVTGQSTTGTGVLTEFTSSFTDLFGAQSGRHNKKLKAGEDICFIRLRKEAMDIGANAVIATDIDYAEIGSGKGILMVCMAGTAVKLKNVNIIGEDKAQLLDELKDVAKRVKWLSRYKTDNI